MDLRAALRALRPREHGLWAWALVPQLGALALAPRFGTLLAALAVAAGFGASNALGSALRQRDPAAGLGAALAAGVALALAAAAAPVLERPGVMAGAFGVAGALGGGLLLATGGRLPRARALELPGLLTLTGLGGAVAVAGGAPAGPAGALAALLFGWFVIGIAWVDRQVARVMPGRVPWSAGPVAAGLASLGAAGVALGADRPALVPLLALYLGRARLHAPPRTPRDLKRVGLTELGWAVAVALLGATAARG